jgi:hypothetical protein
MDGECKADRALSEAERLLNVRCLGHCLHENRSVWNSWSMGWFSRYRDCKVEIQVDDYTQAKLPSATWCYIYCMTRENFELGVWRLYHVIWVVGLASLLVAMGGKIWEAHEFEEDLEWLIFLFALVSAIAGPLIFKYVVRWIYRGFFPKV